MPPAAPGVALFDLTGQTALVTGAGGGIGSALALGLAAAGADVALLDRPGVPLDATVGQLHQLGRRALAVAADVTDPASLERAVLTTENELGPLRLAVNCAGLHSTAPAEQLTVASWQQLLDVNLTGVFLSCQAQARAMLRHHQATGQRAAIVNIASIAATIANRGLRQAHYNASKAAVVALGRSLALEWADRGIRVNTVSPGYVRTPMSGHGASSRTLAQYLDDIPLGRMAWPAELVGPVVFLLSEAASYCTATELVVDGGAVAW